MKFLQKAKKLSLITVAVAAVIGLVFIIFPSQCIKYGSLAIGLGLIVIGACSILNYFRDKSGTFSLIMGVIILIVGIIVCVKYKAIISLIIIIFGIFILTSGIVNFVTSIKSIVLKPISAWFSVLLSVITVIFGIVAICNSNQLSESIVRFVGVSLLAYCVVGVLTYFQIKDYVSKSTSSAMPNGDIPTDAKIINQDNNQN